MGIIAHSRKDRCTRQPLSSSGIYYIVCCCTGKYYIGSAINIKGRWSAHRSELRRNKHDNGRLQNAWNKYGEENFRFEVLEFCSGDVLLAREQHWIDAANTTNRNTGYNIGAVTGSPRGCRRSKEMKEKLSRDRQQTWTGFIDPDGNIVSIVNLRKFCRENGMDFSSMWHLSRGKLLSYREWKHVSGISHMRPSLKTYTGFVDPQGVPVAPIRGLHRFCRDRGLDISGMMQLIREPHRSHKGWTYIPVSDGNALEPV